MIEPWITIGLALYCIPVLIGIRHFEEMSEDLYYVMLDEEPKFAHLHKIIFSILVLGWPLVGLAVAFTPEDRSL